MGSATPQNIKPIPMPAANNIENQLRRLNSGLASAPPNLTLATGSTVSARQNNNIALTEIIMKLSNVAKHQLRAAPSISLVATGNWMVSMTKATMKRGADKEHRVVDVHAHHLDIVFSNGVVRLVSCCHLPHNAQCVT